MLPQFLLHCRQTQIFGISNYCQMWENTRRKGKKEKKMNVQRRDKVYFYNLYLLCS